MSENKNTNSSAAAQETSLGDESRVRVLSPGMLVAKRFVRNRLAMFGLIIIVCMFLFAFLGGVVSPYGEAQVFRKVEKTEKDYAGAKHNEDYKFAYASKEKTLSGRAQSQLILAINQGKDTFEVDGNTYSLKAMGEAGYKISGAMEIGSATFLRGIYVYDKTSTPELTDEIKTAFEEANNEGETSFEVDGTTYMITQAGRSLKISSGAEYGFATRYIFNTFSEDEELSYELRSAAVSALAEGKDSFETPEGKYKLSYDKESDSAVITNAAGEEVALLSRFSVSPIVSGIHLSIDYIRTVEEAITNGENSFTFPNKDGEDQEYKLNLKNEQYVIRTLQDTQLNDNYSYPSKAHPLGTDGNGMDILTRLMYGGRVSLMIGFIVILLEIAIGVVMGGLAGFFGGWVDNIIMRMVDIVYCIPAMPLYIILGSIMDSFKISPKIRIYFLCLVLGLLGWAGIARMVRGQILSLREQEFMIAAEATGISVHRRIFVHLIPNVFPQLIVIATMGLGDVILTEATLSFLGLGVKYPFASWGNIINAVNDSYVMSTFWFVWIPAGTLILLTVLGFNFIGDGLRDAFDPKMKR